MTGPDTSAAVAAGGLRVVHVIPTLTTGGAERQLELLVARSAYPATTWCLYAGGPVADSMAAAGQPVQILGMAGWRKPLAVLRLARHLRRARPDIVHVHLLAAQLWGIPAARLARVPVVVSTEHSLMDTTIEGRPHRWWLRQLYRVLERCTTQTVAVSATTAQRLRRWQVPAARITVIDNGIDFAALRFDPQARRAVRAELGLGEEIVVGVVGRLEPVKRVDEVLDALAPHLRAGGGTLLVAGAGPLRATLQDHARRLGIDGAVRWLGARRDVPRVLCAIDLLVSASRDETFGMAVVEALGSGLPVVYAQCPALEELPTRPAWAVPAAAGESGLADAVDRAVGLDLHGPRRAVPAELRERYGADATAAALDRLYVRLVAGARRDRQPTVPESREVA